MDNKKLFEAALSAKMSDYPFSDTKTVMNNIMERAEKMKNHENAKQMKFTEITPEYIEPKKSHKAISVVAGIAGTAAVLTGAVFGLNWLNEHGGLKEGGIESNNGAGYHDTSETAGALQTDVPYTMPAKEGEEFVAPDFDLPVPETLPDIRFAYGNKLIFHDAEVTLSGINYDGNKLEAFFDLLYTGDDYENYSPLYARVDINYTMTDGEIEYIQSDDYEENFTCQLFENPEPDSSFIVVYTVPIKLEPNKDYAVSIAYFNPDHNGQNGSSTQGIEADRLRYKYVYKPSQKSGLNELPDITGLNIEDAKEILENAHINYSISRHASDEVPENCVIRTLPQAGAEINSSVIVSISVSSSVPAVFDDFAAAGKVYGLDLLDFGVGVKVHAAQVFGCEIIQASKYMENVQFNEDGTIGGEVPTTIGSPNESRGSIKPELVMQTVILADTLEERMNGFKNMISNNIEDCEHESYYSEKLGLTVDVYYGRTGNVSNGFGTENITSVAVFDDGDALYMLSFENTACLADVETAARKVTDYDQKNGYYEGEEALNILKQYAGEDYCFPFDKLEKEKVSYYDGDKWTNSDEIKFNFAVGEEGVPIKAITGGTVIETFSRNVPGYREGIYITIQAADGRKWRYRHLSDFYVTEGDTVRAGDVIAAVGATGWCTGPCLTISFPDDEAEPTALEGGIVGTATNID